MYRLYMATSSHPPFCTAVLAYDGNFTTVTLVNVGVLPALQGLGMFTALLQFAAGEVNVPHTHPYGTQVLFVLEGTVVDVGLIDTTNKLLTHTPKAGDIFVLPKGLVLFLINFRKHPIN